MSVLGELKGDAVKDVRRHPKSMHELHAATRIVPNIKRNAATCAGDAVHLPERFQLVGHEV